MLGFANGLKTTIPGLLNSDLMDKDPRGGPETRDPEASTSGVSVARSVSRACFYFPMQNVEKITFRMSSLVVSPVSESR
jgi:hypothetical protein